MYASFINRKWFSQHRNDHTHAEIEALGIELRFNDKILVNTNIKDSRGIVKKLVTLNKGVGKHAKSG